MKRYLLLLLVICGVAFMYKENCNLSVSRVGIDDKPYYAGGSIAAGSEVAKRQERGR